jgi:hypothetical protein
MGCAPKTTVSFSGNVPAQFQHVYVTVQEVWFNTSATAGPDDTAWLKFALATPQTIDLAASMKGQLTPLTAPLNVPIGTYQQVRLIPVDSGTAAVQSALSATATYNAEVDYFDSSGTPQKAPLEFQNPDKGIGIATSILVKGGTINVLASSSTTSTTGTGDTTGTSTSSDPTANVKPFLLAINVDGAKDLVWFNYAGGGPQVGSVIPTGGVRAILLNPHVSAYDTSQVGAVQGTLNLQNVLAAAQIPGNQAFVDIQVTAESLSTDGTRHVAVNSAPVAVDGTFTLYPLAPSSPTLPSYDLVIHGPAIATIIVKGVTVNAGVPGSTTPVNIGTITPRAAGQTFKVNLTTPTTTTSIANATTLPAGAQVGFYQTLPGSTEVPYLIELRSIDPFNLVFASDQTLSAATIDSGTFSSSGSTVGLRTFTPAEGTSTYRVAALAPLFTDTVLTTAPTVGQTAATVFVTPAALLSASGATGTAQISVNQANKRFDHGQIIISHDGAIVAANALDAALQSGNLTIGGLPSGTGFGGTYDPALYYVSVRVWSSSDPAGTLTREIYPTALDMRAGSATYSLTIN